MAGRLSVNVERWLEGKTVEDFEAIEHGKHLLFPDAITRYDSKGKAVDVPVLIRVPGADDILAGRFIAIAHVNKMLAKHKVKAEVRTLDEARSAVGLDHFENMENQAIVAQCLHEPSTKEHQLMYTLEMLRAEFLPTAISAVFHRMSILNVMLDPNLDELTEEQFWHAVDAIAETRSLSPLGVMRGNTGHAFSVRACVELRALRDALHQLTQNSSSTSTETSTPGS